MLLTGSVKVRVAHAQLRVNVLQKMKEVSDTNDSMLLLVFVFDWPQAYINPAVAQGKKNSYEI